MHQDKKREELEQRMEFEQLQQEQLFESEETVEGEEEKEIEKQPEIFENEIERAKKKRKELIFELVLFFVLGFLVGVMLKTEAIKKITIGFNDYQIETGVERYDVTSIKRNLEQQALDQQKQIQEQSTVQRDVQAQPQQ